MFLFRDKQLEAIKQVFLDRLHIDKTWSLWFVFCEFLNAVNIVLQVYLTNWFLAGNFYSLGPKALEEGLDGEVYVLDYVFPKVKTNLKYLISDKCCLLDISGNKMFLPQIWSIGNYSVL